MSHARTKMRPDGVSLAHKRMDTFLDVYGECRDSEQTRSVCEPVGMAKLRGSEPCTDKNGDRRCEPCSPSPCTDNLILVLLCSYGGIGRRGRFRFCWATPVQVQVLLAAFFFFKTIMFKTIMIRYGVLIIHPLPDYFTYLSFCPIPLVFTLYPCFIPPARLR